MKQKNAFKPMLIMSVTLVVTLFISRFSLFGGEDPKVRKGAKVTIASGSLVNWKDLKKVKMDELGKNRKMKPILNFKNPKKIVNKPTPYDPAAQVGFSGVKDEGKSLEKNMLGMTEVRNFAGMNFNENGAGWPPDTCGDVGPNHYVQAVNTSIGIYDKTTGTLISATTFDEFFPSSVGDPCDYYNNGDVIVLYDRYNQRWFLLDFSWNWDAFTGYYYSIAASKTSDPTGEWWTYCLLADAYLLNDYPKCGIWHDGIYITANMFDYDSGDFYYSRVWALKIPDIYNGTLVSQSVTDNNYYAWSLLPGNSKGATAPPAGSPNYFYSMDADEYGPPSSDALYVWKYDVDWNDPGNTTWTGPINIPGVAAFGLTANYVPQLGTGNQLDSLYGRLMYPANYINFGTYASVYLCHLVEFNNHRTMRWYEIRINGGTSSIYQQGTYAPDVHHRWMGSVCGDKNGNIAMGYSISSSTMYPGIRYCGRLSTDPPGNMAQGEATLVNGGGYQDYFDRWGDYSHLTLDPDDNETLWYTQEYYTSPGNNWQTRIGAFKVGGSTSTADINQAVDNLALKFTKTGDALWKKVTDVYYYDNDSARSGFIYNNQSCSIQAIINYAVSKTIKFYWKVSSEPNYDYLQFYIDSTLAAQVSGSAGWTQKTFSVTAGPHTLKWVYAKDGSMASGSDCGWVDKVEILDGAADTIAEAVDIPILSFIKTGSPAWSRVTDTYYYGNDSAKSGAITHGQSCSIQSTINYPTRQNVKFYWKVSSESNCDYLNFYIDGVLKDQVSGEVNWQPKGYTINAGSHTLKWVYSKNAAVSRGSDCGWLDKLQIIDAAIDPVAEAVDFTALKFNHSGDSKWYKVTDTYYYGNDSARSGTIKDDNTGSIDVDIDYSTPRNIKFYWKVSSEDGCDFLEFYIDGAYQDDISGEVDWNQKSYMVIAGKHNLKWTYYKDYSVSSGSDCGWVDKLELGLGICPIAEAVDKTSLVFTVSGNGAWFSQNYTYYYGNDAAQSPYIYDSQSASMQTVISGYTKVKFWWQVSSEANYDFLNFYIDGTFMAKISGEVKWQQKIFTVTSGTHTLKWVYTKDRDRSGGWDAGWVDKLDLQ